MKRVKMYWGFLTALLIVLVIFLVTADQEGQEGIDIRDVEGIPVLWEHGMPYFTRFLVTDHLKLDLCGMWKFKPDPEDCGVEKRWFDPDVDDTKWSDHLVPGCWNVQRPEWLDYVGAGWYRTRFAVPKSFSSRFNRLVLDGVSFSGYVYLNGKFMGSHSGGFSQWCLDITDSLKYNGENTLVIRVDTRRHYDTLPPLIQEKRPFGWWPYGGITRGIKIESSPWTTVCKLAVDTDHKGWIQGAGVLYRRKNEGTTANIHVRLTDLSGNEIGELLNSKIYIAGGKIKAFGFENKLDGVKPWSPVHPENRYRLEVSMATPDGSECQSLEIGFRKFEFRGLAAYFNDRPFFIRGVNRHEDDPKTGQVQSDARIRKDIALLHGMHANFVRTSHNPNDPRWLDACDREGILLVEEIPLYQVGWGVKSVRAAEKSQLHYEAARQLIEMIERDRNHPSIVMWSLGDECFTFFPSIRRLYKRLYNMSKRFDSRRPVSFAIFIVPFRISPTLDISAGIADVTFVNEYYGWYFGEPEQVGALLDAVHRKWPDKPIVVSEFGAGSLKDSSGGKLYPVGYGTQRDFAEAYQAHLYEVQLECILKKPFVIGTIPWVFADFRDDKRPNNPIPNMNLKGLLTYDRKKKKAYSVIAAAYARIEQKYEHEQ